MASYRTWFAQLATAPLLGDEAQKLVQLLALIGDMVHTLCLEAVQARSIHSGTFPLDALFYVGSERNLPRYGAESDLAYRARLQGAWAAWLSAGSSRAIEDQLALIGYGVKVKELLRGWNWDTATQLWSRFWVVLEGHPFARWSFGTAYTFGGGQVFGCTATPSQIEILRGIITKWKPAHMRCEHLIVVVDKTTWDTQQPNGSWDVASNRSHAAVYLPMRQGQE